MPLRYLTWPGVHAGFHAEVDVPPAGGLDGGLEGGLQESLEEGLLHAGETWAGGGWFVGRHVHPVWELYLQVHGTTRWEAGGEVHPVPAGAMLAVPPGVPHALTDGPTSRHHFFYAALDTAALVDDPDAAALWAAGGPLRARHAESLGAPFRALVRELTGVRPLQRPGIRAAATLLVVEASRLLLPAAGAVPALPRPSSPGVRAARALLDERYRERWRVSDLAGGSGLSATHLADLFTREVGVPPHRYLLGRRIERACELLAGSDLPVTAVALEVGFASGPHLSRAFRAATGCTPRDYRRAARS